MELRKRDLVIADNILSFNTINLKSSRSEKKGSYNVLFKDRYYETIIVSFNLASETGKVLSPFIFNYIKCLAPTDYLFCHLLDRSKHLARNSVYFLVLKADKGLWLHLLRHKRFTDLALKLKGDPYTLNAFTHHKRLDSDLQYIHGVVSREKLLSL